MKLRALLTAVSATCLLTACDAPSSPEASTGPKTPNYARCAGSYEPEKCRAAEEQLAAETPTAAAARRKQMDEERAKNAKAVATIPVPKPQRAVAEQAETNSASASKFEIGPNKRALVSPGGWICIQPTDAVQYSRLRRAGISTNYPGCAQASAPVVVMVLQQSNLAGTPIVGIGMNSGNVWTIEEDLVAAE